MIHELERRLRVTEPVIKFLDRPHRRGQKRLEKIKKLRDAQEESKSASWQFRLRRQKAEGRRPRFQRLKLLQPRRTREASGSVGRAVHARANH